MSRLKGTSEELRFRVERGSRRVSAKRRFRRVFKIALTYRMSAIKRKQAERYSRRVYKIALTYRMSAIKKKQAGEPACFFGVV